jgi:hypothetical protein
VELTVSEVAALARLRSAVAEDYALRLPHALRQSLAARGADGTLRQRVRELLKTTEADGLTGEDQLVAVVGLALLDEAEQVATALRDEAKNQRGLARSADDAAIMVGAAGPNPG